MSPTIAIFTFNTEAQNYCGGVDKIGDSNKILDLIRPKCIQSDFVNQYINYIIEKNQGLLPDIFVVNLQESSIKNPLQGFKSNNLIDRFLSSIQSIDQDYVMIKKKLRGIGTVGLRGLHSCLIVNKKLNVKYLCQVYRPIFSSSVSIIKGQQYGKGAIQIELSIVSNGQIYNIQFINTHLPFIGNEPDQGKQYRDTTLIETINYLQNKFISNVFIIGDMNYRIDFSSDAELAESFLSTIKTIDKMSNDEIKEFIKPYYLYDQLHNTLSKPANNLLDYNEGIDNLGPDFLPTCKLEKICPITNRRRYQIFKNNNYRIPSWCDRILYKGNIKCHLYEKFDSGFTCKSDHIPVIGLYSIVDDETNSLSLNVSTQESRGNYKKYFSSMNKLSLDILPVY